MGVTLRPIGGDDIEVLINDTSVDSSTETEIDLNAIAGFTNLRKLRLLRGKGELVSGAGSTIAPVLARTSGGSGVDAEWQEAAAARHDRNFYDGVAIYAPEGKLWLKWNPDSGSNNACDAQLLLRAGW